MTQLLKKLSRVSPNRDGERPVFDIHVEADSDSWEGDYGLQLEPQTSLQQKPQPQRQVQWDKRRVCRYTTALVLAGVLTVMAGLTLASTITMIPVREHQQQVVVTYGRPSRLVLAMEGSLSASHVLATAGLQQGVTASQALPSSGLQVLTFSSSSAMEQAMAAFANATGVKYMFSDFTIPMDRAVDTVVGPMQLATMAWKAPLPSGHTRRLQQHHQEHVQQQEEQQQQAARQSQAQGLAADAKLHDRAHRRALQETTLPTAMDDGSADMARMQQRMQQRRQGALLARAWLSTTGAVPDTARRPQQELAGLSTKSGAVYSTQSPLQELGPGNLSTALLLPPPEQLPGPQPRQARPPAAASAKQQELASAWAPFAASVAVLPGTPTQQASPLLPVPARPELAAAPTYLAAAMAALAPAAPAPGATGAPAAVGGLPLDLPPADAEQVSAAAMGESEGAAMPQDAGQQKAAAAPTPAAAAGSAHRKQEKSVANTTARPSPVLDNSNPLFQAGYAVPLASQPLQWYLGAGGVNATRAWNVTTGKPGVVVAVIDTGAEVSHPSLGPNVWSNAGEIPGNGIDDDGNGFVDDAGGWNFGGHCIDDGCSACSADSNPTDLSGAGTHAAALAAGVRQDAAGTAGVAPGVAFMPLKVSDCHTRELWASHVLAAYDYALANGAHIVLTPPLPQAAGSTACPAGEAGCSAARRQAFADALKPLGAAGMLVVVPATASAQVPSSNSSSSSSSSSSSWGAKESQPCGPLASMDNVICAVSTAGPTQPTRRDQSSPVTLSAPTAGLFAASAGASYGNMSGTSLAAPLVAGAAALVWSALGEQYNGQYSGLGPMVRQALAGTGTQLDVGLALQRALEKKSELVVFPATPSSAGSTASMQGLEAIYYYNRGQADASQMGWLLKQGMLPSFPLASWAYSGAAALAHVTGTLPVVVPGQYGLMVTSGDAFVASVGAKWLFMERVSQQGQQWVANVTFAAAGNYSLAIEVSNPVGQLNLQWQPPGSTGYSSPSGIWSSGEHQAAATALRSMITERGSSSSSSSASSNAAPQPQQLAAAPGAIAVVPGSRGFVVRYSQQMTGTFHPLMPPDSSTTPCSNSTVLSSLDISTPGQLQQLLFPGNASARSGYGYIEGWLDPAVLAAGASSAAKAAVQFQLTCATCSLVIDSMAVVGSTGNVVQTSPCTALGGDSSSSSSSSSSSNSQLVFLQVAFLGNRLDSSLLSVSYRSCNVLNGSASGSFVPLTQAAAAPGLVLDAAAAASSAYTPGLLCSVRPASYASTSTGGAASSSAGSKPAALTAFIAAATGSTARPFAHTPQQLAPGLAATWPSAASFQVRCWGYWNGTFRQPWSKQGFAVAKANTTRVVAPVGVGTASMYVGPTKVYDSRADWSAAAPVQYVGGGALRLLAMEWVGVQADSPLSVQDAGSPWLVDGAVLRVPAAAAAAAGTTLPL